MIFASVALAAAGLIPASITGPLGSGSALAQVATCGATPALDCRESGGSGVSLKQAGGVKDKLSWKWGKGDATVQADFGDPTSTAGYALCAYSGTHSTLVAEASIPADGVKWSAISTKGYKYKDKTGVDDGVSKVLLKGGAQGKAKVKVKGKGVNLPDPTLPATLPLRVQLINSENGNCFEDVYDGTDIKKHDAAQLKTKAGPEDPSLALPVARAAVPLPAMTAAEAGVPAFVGAPVTATPFTPISLPPHPFLNNEGDSRIHNDHYNSAVYNRVGPLGNGTEITTASMLLPDDFVSVCAMLTFADDGNIVGACIAAFLTPTPGASTRLVMLDPDTLDVYTEVEVAPRQLVQNAAGGAYFSIDNKGRYIIGPATNAVEIWEMKVNGGQPSFMRLASYDVSASMPPTDMMQDTVIDYDGRLWFASITGIVGYVDPATGIVETFDIGEGLQNSFAVDEDGVYIVSFEAMYRFSVDVDDTVKQDWRTPYDNTGPGLVQPGSGTTPTLFGTFEDLVAVADTALPQVNAMIMDRDTGATVCLIPLFTSAAASGAENTFIGYGDEVVSSNNGGFTGTFDPQNTVSPGIERWHVRSDRTGCDPIWINTTAIGNSAQVSSTTGLIYGWGADPTVLALDAYYFTAVDWATGVEVFRVYGGNDTPFNPVLGQPHVSPAGVVYIPSLEGIIRIADTTP